MVPALAAAVILVAALALYGACGSGESKETTTATPGTSTPAVSRTPTPTPTFPDTGVTYVVQDGDTLYDIAQLFGVTVEAIVAANHLPDETSITVGEELIIPDPGFSPGPTVVATTTAADPRLTGFSYPIAGACLPESDNLMPNAPREYRSGIHEGVDFYASDNCVDIPVNAPVMAVKAGKVIRADHSFVEMSPDELNGILARTQAQGYTDAAALDKFRGRQVWIDHGNGIVTRYCHLGGIPEDIAAGMTVSSR